MWAGGRSRGAGRKGAPALAAPASWAWRLVWGQVPASCPLHQNAHARAAHARAAGDGSVAGPTPSTGRAEISVLRFSPTGTWRLPWYRTTNGTISETRLYLKIKFPNGSQSYLVCFLFHIAFHSKDWLISSVLHGSLAHQLGFQAPRVNSSCDANIPHTCTRRGP